MKRLFLAFCLVALTPFTGHSQDKLQHDISYKVTHDFVVPAYENLAKQAEAQAAAWKKSCKADDLKDAYQKTADAWAAVQHITFGPVSLLIRKDRLYHWPERRNAVAKGMTKLLAKEDEALLAPKKFARTSVAVQGLPALERLIYGGLLDSEWSCKVGKTVAQNVATMTKNTAQDWKALQAVIQKGEGHPLYFETMSEVTIRLFTELLAGFQMINEQKIALPMSTSIKKANGRRAEGWRSNRPNRFVTESAHALRNMATPFMHFLPKKDHDELAQQFETFLNAANKLPTLTTAVKDVAGREQLKDFLAISKETRALIIKQFTQHLGIPVGFNNLDGD
ncbi:imelysin family protein [Terasakiella sp. SH-1]|uniref:imelysin family protein n=1 Tax=Terasakiella sp. SH-1 TaxID=2560057 RepID=UPI0010739A1F|nr:imelysin family protein [Terasakiella sp. SH-1]